MSGYRKTGGCQCGAVRFVVDAPLGRAGICHCRMCQKAFGNFFAPLVSAPKAHLTWTKEEPSWFQSSNLVRRGFCAKCGTPLTYDAGGDSMELAVGAFDDPEAIKPSIQVGLQNKMSWFGELDVLPRRTAEQEAERRATFFDHVVSHQHPDHEEGASGSS
ncbi:GFA family protein [Oryzibacter oryziterrae]|uniref:GFA family protein n=1 Tax=Oryzibacter oryziterrae TaxID=2766474 RepID=UPI001F1EB7AC|nr:GFA family protein [Oryzibacter oryziterrae]